MRYLLDTCTFLWLAQQPAMLSPAAIAACNDPASELHVSDASVWEVVLKHSAGKLPLPGPPRAWIAEKIVHHQLTAIPLNFQTICLSGELPRVHSDPFDRIIAAHAIEQGMTILSPDTPLSLLGASRIW